MDNADEYLREKNIMPDRENRLFAQIAGRQKAAGENIINEFKKAKRLPIKNINVDFNEDVWDFRAMIGGLPVSASDYVFAFKASDPYRDLKKAFLAHEILVGNSKIRTLHRKQYFVANLALDQFASDGFLDMGSVPASEYEKVRSSFLTRNDYRGMVGRLLPSLKHLVEFYETHFESMVDGDQIKKVLNDIDYSRLQKNIDASKFPAIPDDFLSRLIEVCREIIKDDSIRINYRITAACLLMYSQIGLRTGELMTMKTNSIKYVHSDILDRDLPYLHFLTYKSGRKDNDAYIARSYLNDIALEAYNALDKLCEQSRKSSGVDYLVWYYGRQNNNQITSSHMTDMTIEFYAYFCKQFDNVNCDDLSDVFRSRPATDRWVKVGRGNLRRDGKTDDLKDTDKIYYPAISQFRVTVCTTLARLHIPLLIIKAHMNHLTENMTTYYIREDQHSNKEYTEKVYNAVVRENAQLIGKNASKFAKKVNDFVNNYMQKHVHADMDEIIKECGKKYPLISKVGGMCIRCGKVTSCDYNDVTNQIYCAFGICPNNCHIFFDLPQTYNECQMIAKAIAVNRRNGKTKANRAEKIKLKSRLSDTLRPEIDDLRKMIGELGENSICDEYPELAYAVHNLDKIMEDVKKWEKMAS